MSAEGRAADPASTWRELSGALVAVAVLAIGLAVIVGLWLDIWAAAAVTVGFALIVISALTVWSMRRAHPPAAGAPHVVPVADQRHRILVVADTHGAASDLAEALLSHARGRPASVISVFVITPALASRLGLLTSDQNGYDDATRRLSEVIATLRVAGIQADGEVGLEDPLQAADDGLRRFPADEILFVTHRERQTNWLEEGVLELAYSRYDKPVEHITVS